MKKLPLIAKILVSPIALAYRAGVGLRNCLFDMGVLSEQTFENTVVIGVGNIAMGGSGKTPMTEYLTKLLSQAGNNVAVLSRGYKRKTSGFRLATEQSLPAEIGDESYQVWQKFKATGKVSVGVCASRREGIYKMLDQAKPAPDVFVLDDCYQHRWVKPDKQILLTDYNNFLTEDSIFPMGTLREPQSAKDRADIVVVTKCPPDVMPIHLNVMAKKLNLYPYQSLYFATLVYATPKPVFRGQTEEGEAAGTGVQGQTAEDTTEGRSALCITGIANPAQFINHVRVNRKETRHLDFGDHHNFGKKDYTAMQDALAQMPQDTVLLTTEKDAVRMKNDKNFPEEMKSRAYYVPIEMRIIDNGEKDFNKKITDYVRDNKHRVRISED